MQSLQPQFNVEVNAQYIKDLSFESPNSPFSLIQNEPPKIELDVNVDIQRFEGSNFEVILKIVATARSSADNEVLFIASIDYAGLFDLNNIPEEYFENILIIYCPTLIFPYARSILSNLVRDGGFPPLMLKPIDFSALYPKQIKTDSDEIN